MIDTPASDLRHRRHPGSRLWLGVFLIGLGMLFLLSQLGVFEALPLGHYWPVLLLALGALRMSLARGHERWGGFWLLVTGIYCAIGVWRPLGLTWNTAWPIFVIGAGVSILGRASSAGRCSRIEARLDR